MNNVEKRLFKNTNDIALKKLGFAMFIFSS